jgi:hypothetical protein
LLGFLRSGTTEETLREQGQKDGEKRKEKKSMAFQLGQNVPKG